MRESSMTVRVFFGLFLALAALPVFAKECRKPWPELQAFESRHVQPDGRVVEFTRSLYRGDAYDFAVELKLAPDGERKE